MIKPIALMTLLLASSALAETVPVKTARGVVDAPLVPETIAVFDLAALDSL